MLTKVKRQGYSSTFWGTLSDTKVDELYENIKIKGKFILFVIHIISLISA